MEIEFYMDKKIYFEESINFNYLKSTNIMPIKK